MVDLPAPFSPSSACASPAQRSMVPSVTARTAPNDLVALCRASTGTASGAAGAGVAGPGVAGPAGVAGDVPAGVAGPAAVGVQAGHALSVVRHARGVGEEHFRKGSRPTVGRQSRPAGIRGDRGSGST